MQQNRPSSRNQPVYGFIDEITSITDFPGFDHFATADKHLFYTSEVSSQIHSDKFTMPHD